MDNNLPVIHPEYITCWENLEYSLLKLEEEQFDILMKSRLYELKSRNKKKEKINSQPREKDIIKTKKENKVEQPSDNHQDPFITQMEELFNQGDTKSILNILKTYEKK